MHFISCFNTFDNYYVMKEELQSFFLFVILIALSVYAISFDYGFWWYHLYFFLWNYSLISDDSMIFWPNYFNQH